MKVCANPRFAHSPQSPNHRNRIGVAEMIANVIAIASAAIAIVGMFAASVIEY